MDLVAQRLADGRWIRVLTVVDQYTRECLTVHTDTALSGEKVAAALDKVVALRGAPKLIRWTTATEFARKAIDHAGRNLQPPAAEFSGAGVTIPAEKISKKPRRLTNAPIIHISSQVFLPLWVLVSTDYGCDRVS
jgi:transposase InsO family protein